MHFHQDIEILYVLDGSLEVEYEDGTHFLNTDQFILVNSNVRHAYHTEGELLLGSLFIDYTMLTEIFGGEHLFFWCNSAEERSESYDKMRYYIRQIFNYYQTTEGQGIALKNSIYYQLIYLITTDFIVKKGMKQYDSLRGIQDERDHELYHVELPGTDHIKGAGGPTVSVAYLFVQIYQTEFRDEFFEIVK